jgi:hypothetical protein
VINTPDYFLTLKRTEMSMAEVETMMMTGTTKPETNKKME